MSVRFLWNFEIFPFPPFFHLLVWLYVIFDPIMQHLVSCCYHEKLGNMSNSKVHCKSKKWKISWTKGQLSLRWLMLIFPPPWKKGPPKALPLINPNDLWQTIPKNVFFSAFIKTLVQVISNENSFIYQDQT